MKAIILIILLTSNIVSGQNTVRQFAENILNEKSKPSDDSLTFQVLDSLFCKSVKDRRFYFNVAMKIAKQSDGALAEGLTTYARDYYVENNNDFMLFSRDFPEVQLKSWIDFVAFDIDLSSDTSTYYKKTVEVLNNLELNCMTCSGFDLARLKEYNKQILATKEGK